MQKLIKGIIDFRQNKLPDYRQKFKELAGKQTPDALLIACSDSRVVPNLFASTDPGDLFVIRNVGNLVPPCLGGEEKEHSVTAALEFCVNNLAIKDVIVCGHSDCGAMRALISDPELRHPFLNKWLQHAKGALDIYERRYDWLSEPPTQFVNQIAQLNVLKQMVHLKTHPVIQKYLIAGTLRVHGWWFDIASADVSAYNTQLKKFELIDEDWAASTL